MGVFNLSIKSKFDSAHFLEGYKGACAQMHGHTWKVECLFEGQKLDELGMVVDFKLLKRELMKIVMELDHHCINYVLPEGTNPTAENIAKWIFKKLKKGAKGFSVRLITVIVWESDDAWASFTE